jgi:hypothetical protein
MKIRPVVAELFHADGKANIYDEANSRFSQCCDIAYKLRDKGMYRVFQKERYNLESV